MSGEALAMAEAMRKRTKQFALRVMTLSRALPKTEEAKLIGRQLLRSGTSVGANYRAVCRSRSKKEFVSKMNVVVEEADETAFWLELLVEGGLVRPSRLRLLLGETNELLAIFSKSLSTARASLRRGDGRRRK
jgi:four helix bundle protein